VIAEGDHIGTGIQNILALGRGHTHHGGILAIDHAKVCVQTAAQFSKVLF